MEEPTRIRFGILGCANIARKVSRAILLSPNSTISAIGSRSIDKASLFASENGFPASAKVYGSYDAVLDDPDVDAAYVPLPTSLHVRWAVMAAEKKKHVLLEKPVALNVKELDTILEACESNGVQFMDATMWMHHPRTAKMRDFLSDPHKFGHVKSDSHKNPTISPSSHKEIVCFHLSHEVHSRKYCTGLKVINQLRCQTRKEFIEARKNCFLYNFRDFKKFNRLPSITTSWIHFKIC